MRNFVLNESLLHPVMTIPELFLLKSVLAHSDRYLEFGCGGSTLLAAQLVKSSVISIETHMEWASKVKENIPLLPRACKTHIVHADIGPIGHLGYPIDASCRDRWPSYYTDVWNNAEAAHVDLVFVDGRFRPASFLSALLHGPVGLLVLIHDYRIRPAYHVVEDFAREIASVENMSLFVKTSDFDEKKARACLQSVAFEPA